MVLQQKVIDL